MESFLDKLTKRLWDKNYPRPLLIFNIISVIQIFAGIGLLIMSFAFPTNASIDIGAIASAIFVIGPIFALFFITTYSDQYVWQVPLYHSIVSFIFIPFIFFSMGNLYGICPLLCALAVIHSYIYFDNLKLQLTFIAIQNAVYIALFVLAFQKPEFFPQLINEGDKRTLFIIGVCLANAYTVAMSLIFKYLFQSDFERTKSLLKDVADVSVRDDITGAYKEDFGKAYLDSEMKKAWNKNEKLCLFVAKIESGAKEKNKYLNDLLLICGFDTLRQSFPQEALVVRYHEDSFFVIYPNCKDELQLENTLDEIRDKFIITKDVSDIKDGEIKIGYQYLKYGMTVESFIESAEKNLLNEKEVRS